MDTEPDAPAPSERPREPATEEVRAAPALEVTAPAPAVTEDMPPVAEKPAAAPEVAAEPEVARAPEATPTPDVAIAPEVAAAPRLAAAPVPEEAAATRVAPGSAAAPALEGAAAPRVAPASVVAPALEGAAAPRVVPSAELAGGPNVVVAPDGAPAADKAPRKRRWLRAVAVVLGVLLGMAVAFAVIAPGYLRGRIIDEARFRGITLAFEDVDFGFSKIVLRGAKVALVGVPDFEASAGALEVEITDWEPTAIVASQLEIGMFGTEVVSQLGAWKALHPSALAAPLRAEGARVDWHLARGTTPVLTFGAAKVAVEAERGVVDSGAARLFGRDAGPMKVTWTMPASGFVVEIRPTAPPLSAVRAEVKSAKEGARVKVVLERTMLAPLQEALGLPRGSEGIQADGEVELPLPSIAKPAPVEGTLRMTVKGYVPPHPRELDGILFGDTTKVQSKFVLAADGSGAKLSQVAVEAGALALSGSGDVVREGFDARVTLKLKGSIPCTALATSAAVAHLGGAWGRLAGGLASGALKGSVAVSLGIDVKASDVKSAKIDQNARIGCKVVVPGLPVIVLQ